MKIDLRKFISELKSFYDFFIDVVISDKYKGNLKDAGSWEKMNDNYGIPEEDNIIVPFIRNKDDIYISNICLELRFIGDCIDEVMEFVVSENTDKNHVFSWEKSDRISEKLND